MVITELADHPKVRHTVYLSALWPERGQSALNLMGMCCHPYLSCGLMVRWRSRMNSSSLGRRSAPTWTGTALNSMLSRFVLQSYSYSHRAEHGTRSDHIRPRT